MRDARGAVFVEKLIALLPLLLVFFVGWQLAEVAAAQLVVQRASAAAGRAAMVVLPDDPQFYGDEPPDSYTGARRAEIELAAGMVLSAIPQMSSNFEVEVTDPPQGFGSIDVTVRAPYDCGNLGLLCNGGALTLTATTKHAYHGARYDYSVPAGSEVASTGQALTAEGGGPVVGTALALNGAPKKNAGAKGCSVVDCNSDGSFANNPYVIPRAQRTHATQIPSSKSNDLAAAARRARCDDQTVKKVDTTQRNFGSLGYSCTDASGKKTQYPPLVISSDKDAGHSEAQLLALFDVEKRGKGDCKIDGLFTEREPCPVCSSLIGQRSDVSAGFRTTYLFEWNVGDRDIKVEGIVPPRCPGFIDQKTNPKDACREIKKATEKSGAKIPPNIDECIDALMKMEAADRLKRLRAQTDRRLAQLGRQCAGL